MPGGLLDGRGHDIGLAGCVSSGVKWGEVGILGADDVNVVVGHAQRLSCHLAKSRVGTLADLGGADLQMHGTILVQRKAGA